MNFKKNKQTPCLYDSLYYFENTFQNWIERITLSIIKIKESFSKIY